MIAALFVAFAAVAGFFYTGLAAETEQNAGADDGIASSNQLLCWSPALEERALMGEDRVNHALGVSFHGDADALRLTALASANQDFGSLRFNGHALGEPEITAVEIAAAAAVECLDRDDLAQLTWTLDPAWVHTEAPNRITSEREIALAEVQLEATGALVASATVIQVDIPSTYHRNYFGYTTTPNAIQIPAGYDPDGDPVPLLITVHGYGSSRNDVLNAYGPAANARGWLLISPELHGERPPQETWMSPGYHVAGSRASQYDVIDALNYMLENHNVDPNRVYLVGDSMGAMTALMTAAKWPQHFAGLVADSMINNLVEWEYEMRDGQATPNPGVRNRLHHEAGGLPHQQPWEYDRRGPIEYAANFKHMPVRLYHGTGDVTVDFHHSEDFYRALRLEGAQHFELIRRPGARHLERPSSYYGEALDWLAQWERPEQMPLEISFRRDEPGPTYWIMVEQPNQPDHWTGVFEAKFNPERFELSMNVEQGLQFYFADFTASLKIDLGALGLPDGNYIVEDLDLDSGEFVPSLQSSVDGFLALPVTPTFRRLGVYPGSELPEYDVLGLQRGMSAVVDTYISEWHPTTNYGTSNVLRLYSHRINHPVHAFPDPRDPDVPQIKDLQSALIRHDLSSLPADAVVRAAGLTVFNTTGPGNINRMHVGAFPLNREWHEMQATWNRARAGQNWTEPGARAVPADRSGEMAAMRLFRADCPCDPPQNLNRWYGFDMTELVHEWGSGARENLGLIIRTVVDTSHTSSKNTPFSLAASEDGNPDRRPQMVVIYTLDDPVQTPAPTATATPTPTPTPPTATVMGRVFVDENGNGVWDPGEPGVEGATVSVHREGDLVDSMVTDASGTYTFDELDPGVYRLSRQNPPGYSSGGHADELNVYLQAAQTLEWNFPTYIGPTPTPTMTPTPTYTFTPTPTATPTATPTLAPITPGPPLKYRTYVPMYGRNSQNEGG